ACRPFCAAFGLAPRVAAATNRVERSGFHGAGCAEQDHAKPVSRTSGGAEFLGNVVRALRGGSALAGGDAAPPEVERRDRAGGERGRGPECLPAVREESRREPGHGARSEREKQSALR